MCQFVPCINVILYYCIASNIDIIIQLLFNLYLIFISIYFISIFVRIRSDTNTHKNENQALGYIYPLAGIIVIGPYLEETGTGMIDVNLILLLVMLFLFFFLLLLLLYKKNNKNFNTENFIEMQ